MSFIQLLLHILPLIAKTIQFYDVKFGRLNVSYYRNDDFCSMNPIGEAIYEVDPENEDRNIFILNEEKGKIEYSYDFNFFSGEIFYYDESEEEEEVQGSLLCNGNCYKRREGSDIILGPNEENNQDYETLNSEYQYYSCLYNNIIKNATITIKRFRDKKCKEGEGEFIFKGNEYCWNFNGFSIKPLYFEDENKHIYYHDYDKENCTNNYKRYYSFNKYYYNCDNKCHENRFDNKSSYRCLFKDNKYIILKKFLLLICVFLLS
jgi:hypothetical protein